MSVLKRAYALGQEEALRQLATPGLFGKLESKLVGGAPATPASALDPATQAQITRERRALSKQFGVKPLLTGSMPLGLAIPGEVDIDFFARARDQAHLDEITKKLMEGGYYKPSPFNVTGANYAVFTAPTEATGGTPIDFAVAHGDPAKAYAESVKRNMQAAAQIPDDLRQQLIERKRVLKNTPFDVKHLRYKAFKRKIDRTLSGPEGPVRLTRDKIARILNLENPDDADHLKSFLANPNLYGHRTTNAESVLESGKIMPGLEAMRRGLLKDYESGFLPGLRSEFHLPELSHDQLRRLSAATLQAQGPDTAMIQSIAKETGSDPLSLKGALIRHRTKDVNQFLETLGDKAEDWRVNHLRIPKLSPNIFLTHGGLVDDKGYGDVGFLMHTNKAQTSPYLTMVNHEAIVAPKSGLRMQTLNARKGLVVAPQERLQELETAHPDYTYVAESALPKEKLLPAISVGELGRRVLPQLAEGTLKVRQG